LAPVTLEVGQAPYQLGVERRHVRSGGRERPAPLPQQLTVLNFRRGETLAATMFHHACHPTLHHDYSVSADFPGAATSALEADCDIALYLQGCCGNVNPDHYAGATFLPGEPGDITAMGQALATAVHSTPTSPITADISSRR